MFSPSKGRGSRGEPSVTSTQRWAAIAVGVLVGYIVGYVAMETADHVWASSQRGTRVMLQQGKPAVAVDAAAKTTDGSTIHSLLTSNGSPYQNFQGRIIGNDRPAGDTIHSLMTSGGDSYQNFQSRIMYGTYKLVQKMPGGEKLTGFTRILHRMTPDELMDEIPTFRANPLHPKCDEWCDFPVADRPNAVQQWIDAVEQEPSLLKGAWVLILECDYVWMKPLQAPDANDPNVPGLQFHFDYIQPDHPDCAYIMKRLSGGIDASSIPASGPAPALIRFKDLKAVTPEWERVTAAIEADKEAVKVLDWVREMYAWDIGIAKANVSMLTQTPPNSKLIAQPPHDLTIGDACMMHYTWGALYSEAPKDGKKGKEFYRWEKRDFTAREHALKVPHLPLPPKWQSGWVLQDGLPIGEELHNTLVAMLTQMNKAIDSLPDLTGKV